MIELLSVPLKKPSDVDIESPLTDLIQARYSTADKPVDYTEQIKEFIKLRNNAFWPDFEKYESSLEVIYRYYDQLVALEGKIPSREVQIPFKWKDAFDKAVASLEYEKTCILFNIAALQSAVAAVQSVEHEEGLTLATKLLQQASGIYVHLKANKLSIPKDPTSDLNPDTLGTLSALMLAQAQEVFVQKAIHDNKGHIVAKLASQCGDLYGECLQNLQRKNLKQLWDKDWIPTVAGKQAGYHAIAEYYQSLVCKSKKIVGEEIARLEHAVELFNAAQARSGKPMFAEIAGKTQHNLNMIKKDNDLIYHERVPDIKSLELIGKAKFAKIIPLTHPLSRNFNDMFSQLVPVSVHQTIDAHEFKKSEIQNAEISKLRKSTQFLNSVLASLNLPAAIEITGDGSLPPLILEKPDSVHQLGGSKQLSSLYGNLPELLKRNQDILDENDRMLNDEQAEDTALRQQFKECWTRPPSEKLTATFRSNFAKFQSIINNAVEADTTVREQFETYRACMELLSKSPGKLQLAVPTSPGGVRNSLPCVILQQLMEEVATVKAERDMLESDLNSATLDMKSPENLGVIYGPLQNRVKESVAKQEDLIERIQYAYSGFSNETGARAGGRENMMCQLAAAYDAHELQNNLQEGTQFYNNLTEILVAFQNKISDFCFARKTEKDELLKDLTRPASKPVPTLASWIPFYYRGVKPSGPPQQSPTSSSQQALSLPYPMYTQEMPIPYGATASYVPPYMAKDYNPNEPQPYQ